MLAAHRLRTNGLEYLNKCNKGLSIYIHILYNIHIIHTPLLPQAHTLYDPFIRKIHSEAIIYLRQQSSGYPF